MPETFIVKHHGQEVARVTGEGITMGKKAVGSSFSAQLVDDDRLLKIVRDGITVLVFYMSSSPTVTVEKISD